MKFPRRKINLNRAKMKEKDLNNLRIRTQVVQRQDSKAHEENMVAAMLRDELDHFRRNLLKQYKLRPGKEYVFDMQSGYIHRPKVPPTEEELKRLEAQPIPDSDAQSISEDARAAKTGAVSEPALDGEAPPVSPTSNGKVANKAVAA